MSGSCAIEHAVNLSSGINLTFLKPFRGLYCNNLFTVMIFSQNSTRLKNVLVGHCCDELQQEVKGHRQRLGMLGALLDQLLNSSTVEERK